jgi:hypothetical protein
MLPCTMLPCPFSHSPLAPSRCTACHLLLTCRRHEQRQVSGTTRATHHLFDRMCKRYMNMASCLLLSDFFIENHVWCLALRCRKKISLPHQVFLGVLFVHDERSRSIVPYALTSFAKNTKINNLVTLLFLAAKII